VAHRKKKKKIETMGAPQNRRFYGKMDCLPLWPSYIGEKGRTSKHMGLKPGAIGNILGEHIGNLMGTHWEQRNKGKKKKKSSPP
jgi:hypothetical protein